MDDTTTKKPQRSRAPVVVSCRCLNLDTTTTGTSTISTSTMLTTRKPTAAPPIATRAATSPTSVMATLVMPATGKMGTSGATTTTTTTTTVKTTATTTPTTMMMTMTTTTEASSTTTTTTPTTVPTPTFIPQHSRNDPLAQPGVHLLPAGDGGDDNRTVNGAAAFAPADVEAAAAAAGSSSSSLSSLTAITATASASLRATWRLEMPMERLPSSSESGEPGVSSSLGVPSLSPISALSSSSSSSPSCSLVPLQSCSTPLSLSRGAVKADSLATAWSLGIMMTSAVCRIVSGVLCGAGSGSSKGSDRRHRRRLSRGGVVAAAGLLGEGGVGGAWGVRLLLLAGLLSGEAGRGAQVGAGGARGAHVLKAHIAGNITLGGLFPIHVKGENAKCGGINKDRGIQRLEAMLFAIDRINADPTILPNITLGATILDTCSSDSYALNQSLEFIRASINTADPHNYYCHGGGNLTLKPEASAPISGVIGGSYSEVSLQVANLLRLFRIPQISPASTGTALSDKTRYDFFARTVPPDTFQAIAMVAVVQTFNWSYVSLVYSEGQYGESGQEQFTKEARHHNICIAISEKIPHSATEQQYLSVLERLQQKPNAKGVVLFVRAEDAEGVLRAAKELKRKYRGTLQSFDFYWIASDGWGARALAEDMQEAAEGAITIELESRRIEDFDRYMLGLTVENNERNPWFRDYWEAVFECKIRNTSSERDAISSSGDTSRDNSSLPTCSQNLNISATKDGYKQENKVQFVVDAVYAMAHAIDKVRKDVCPGDGVCPKFKEVDGGLIYQALLNVSFVDLVNSTVRFDEKGDGQAPYIIYNYRRNNLTGEFRYQKVGKWLGVEEGLELTTDDITFGSSKDTHDRCFFG